MRFFLIAIFILLTCPSYAQYSVRGSISDEQNTPAKAEINLLRSDSLIWHGATDKAGSFNMQHISAGKYFLHISAHGMEPYRDSIYVRNDTDLGRIVMLLLSQTLNEVSVVQKVLAMVQKDDTMEYNSGAYKVNPDADAADLVRKMPGIDINGKQISAQGETVVKVLVDGKPFFGDDPYASLKNLPADVIAKVQVYNEKSDQERFTGFSEGATSKTVNIITKADKRNGVFGNVYAGYGNDNSNEEKYGAGYTLNRFKEDKRVTLTGQFNNVNAQNFSTDASAVSGGAGAGITKTNAAGINFSDKWGKKADVSASYFFNETNSTASRLVTKTYLLAADSGQVYKEQSPYNNQSYGHRFNMRFNYTFDSFNSLLFTPALNIGTNDGVTVRNGITTEGGSLINSIGDTSNRNGTTLGFSGNLLYRHRFAKKGRTFSLSVTGTDNGNTGTTLHQASNIYYLSPALNDTLNQRSVQNQYNPNITGNATYTEPVGEKGMLKAEYNVSYQPAHSERTTSDFSDASNAYAVLDTAFSNTFYADNISHKAGLSYQLHLKNGEVSVGANYQATELRNDQQYPVVYHLDRSFSNVLPVASFQYKFSKTKNLHINYNTSTQAPSVSQLQNVINNADPLHLYMGNPGLQQPYQHSLIVRYNQTGKDGKTSFSASLNGNYTQHYILSGSVIAASDSTVGHGIVLAKGSQLTVPVNTEGYKSISGNISYGVPLSFIKCRLNINLNGGVTHVPGIINYQRNDQQNSNGGAGISINSNISENVDFSISSNTNIVSTTNSINSQLNTTYINESTRATLNLIMWKGIVFNTAVSYHTNSGLSAGFNQNYALWNLSLGKKIFKKRQGDIRLTVFDVLNENSNIQHSVTDAYIQDTRTNTVQRYYLLVFTYKLREFGK